MEEISKTKSDHNNKLSGLDFPPLAIFEKAKATVSVAVQTDEPPKLTLDQYAIPAIRVLPKSAILGSPSGKPNHDIGSSAKKGSGLATREVSPIVQGDGDGDFKITRSKKVSTGSLKCCQMTLKLEDNKKPTSDISMVLSTAQENNCESDTYFHFQGGDALPSMSYVLPDENSVLAIGSLDGGKGCLKQTLLLIKRLERNPLHRGAIGIPKLLFQVVYHGDNRCKDIIISKADPTKHHSNFIRVKNILNKPEKYFDVLFLVNDYELMFYHSKHDPNWVFNISKDFVIYKDPVVQGKRLILDFQFVADPNCLQFAVLSSCENSYFLSFVEVVQTESSKPRAKRLFEVELKEVSRAIILKSFIWNAEFSRVILFGEQDKEAYVGDVKITDLRKALQKPNLGIEGPTHCQVDLEMYKCQGSNSEENPRIEGGRVEFVERKEVVGLEREMEWTIAAFFEQANTLAMISIPWKKKPLAIQMLLMKEVEKDIRGGNLLPRMKGIGFSNENQEDDEDKGKFVKVSLAISDGKIRDILIPRRLEN